ncbi:hypothetical protein MHH81_21030 [Psychrobacillus sp. FSL H8-0484]|uniref:hypothetical protein n=1 Tax=Psychrobacillus sp. FSL H8-0484 TaxID=2921390 RepID=UPI0030F92A0B
MEIKLIRNVLPLRSPEVQNANLSEEEETIIRQFIYHSIQEKINKVKLSHFYTGLQSGIDLTLHMLNRQDLLDLIKAESLHHPELN